MKFLLVNAVYLPNYLGGATIICKNIADQLVQKGHQVNVFCGYYDKNLPPLTLKKHVVDGVDVYSYNVQDAIEITNEKSYRNRGLTEQFQNFLCAYKPDLVHFHSLQGLGADLIQTAKEQGARVVFSVHDYWLACPEHFLVRAYQGICGIDGFDHVFNEKCNCLDKNFLRARREHLKKTASQADLILTVSRNVKEFLETIGFPPEKIRINENGIIAPHNLYRRSSFPRTVKYGYIGSINYFKGYFLLIKAIDSLKYKKKMKFLLYCTSDDRRNKIIKYIDRKIIRAKNLLKRILNRTFSTNYQLGINNPIVDMLPAFTQHELDDVYGKMDVLLAPSIMRESCCLAVREALARGVPVIVTNSKGPEEVIRNGVNGFIVQADDPEELKEKIILCAKDRRLLARLKDGARETKIKTVSEQMDELMGIYKELLGTEI
jgi:glycosyltransferase involved in cell wall biosynthesis